MTRSAAVTEVRLIATAALGAGLTTAALHLTLRASHLLLFSEYQPIGPDAIWMAPLAEGAFFLVVAAPFMLVAAVRPGPRVTSAAVFAVFTLAVFFVGLQSRWVHPAAALMLALGIAWRLRMFWIANLERAARTTYRLTAAWAIAFTVSGGLGVLGARDRGALATPGAGAPNVLILLLDTVGARHLSMYGYARQTSPHLDSLAREGTMFERAIAPSSWTLPSHASVFTGLPAAALSSRWTVPLDHTHPTLAERFAARGYRTAGFTANLIYTIPATGLARGFQYYRVDRRTIKGILRHGTFVQTPFFRQLRGGTGSSRLRALLRPDFGIGWEPHKQAKPASFVASDFLGWQANIGSAPFFAFLNFFDAHHPYWPPPAFMSRFGADSSNLNRHDGAIAYADQVIGALLDTLRIRGALDNTVVVVTSDHGEAFGEHGLGGHGNSLYLEALHVPLVLRYPPSVPAGKREPAVVSLTDLGATLLDLADPSRPPDFPGHSLSASWRLDDPPARVAVSWVERSLQPNEPTSGGDLAAATDDRYTLIVAQDGNLELYDHRDDPDQERDLADVPVMAPVVAALRAVLSAITGEWEPGRP